MTEYYINKETSLIIPIDENHTKVIENNTEYIIDSNCMDVVNESCMYYGSNYQGRYMGSKKILNMNYKLPIVLDEYNEIIIFPTSSPRLKGCTWLVLQNIENYSKFEEKTLVTLKNGVSFKVEISYGSFESQIFRASMLLMLLKKRKKV